MKKPVLILSATIAVLFSGCDSLVDSPVDAQYFYDTSNVWDMKYKMKLIGARDSVTIKGVKINRGNCKFKSPTGKTVTNWKANMTLGFGEEYAFEIFCTPKEIEIKTNKGDHTLYFSRN